MGGNTCSPALPDLAIRTILTDIALLPILTAVLVWLVVQTLEKNVWNVLRFLPLLASFLLFPFLSWWQGEILGVVLVADLAIEGGSFLLAIGGRWIARHRLVVALLTLFVTVSMVLMCIVNGVWIVAVWQLIPRVTLIDPNWQTGLMLQLVLTVLTTIIALFGFMHGTLARRAVDTPPPKQEPLHPVHEQG